MTGDLAAFLAARLDVDENEADQVICEWHDNDRRLREVAAKRAILELARHANDLEMQVDSEFRVADRDENAEPYTGDLIQRHLAAVYSDHPGYRQEWAPGG